MTPSFLERVVARKRDEAARLRRSPPAAPAPRPRLSFADALRSKTPAVIAEIKRSSPSRGAINADLDAASLAAAYLSGGAAAISCLTDHEDFGARPGDFAAARAARLPTLRKDFVVDAVQIDESAAMGASAVLLIARILSGAELRAFVERAEDLGLGALVETHDAVDIERAVDAGARVIGVNNRDLETLAVDPRRAEALRRAIPDGVMAVAESGIRARADVDRLAAAGYDAFLVGEALSASADPAARILELFGTVRRRTWVKVCGITSVADARCAADAGASALGVVLSDSPRRVDLSTARAIREAVRGRVEVVGVSRESGVLEDAHRSIGFDRLQIHGAGIVRGGGASVLRAIASAAQAGRMAEGEIAVLDASEGNGRRGAIDASAVAAPFVVAGGLDPENVGDVVRAVAPWGVDASSGLEISPGRKDPGKVRAFVAAVRRADG